MNVSTNIHFTHNFSECCRNPGLMLVHLFYFTSSLQFSLMIIIIISTVMQLHLSKAEIQACYEELVKAIISHWKNRAK